MKKYFFIVIGIIFFIWLILGYTNQYINISPNYSNGKVVTSVAAKGIKNITSTEFRYKTYFLDQYENMGPKVDVYSFPEYKQKHIYEISSDLLQGKKDLLEIEVAVFYGDGTQQIIKKEVLEGIKEKIYSDFVIKPEIKEDKVYYKADGLTAIIDKQLFNDEIIFYSDPNGEYPNLFVGFEKDFTLYPLKSYGILPKAEAIERSHEGFIQVDFDIEPGADDSYTVVEHGMIDLVWDGLYPYDLEGNKVFYKGNKGDTKITLITDNGISEISKASHEKYREMLEKIPDIDFILQKK